ncbi:MAG: glycosyltransferase, partial [Ilumatobacteraceae bacterium]|nr:glycosyltransferase [Ilumatobacteraceae bacterium]
QPDLEALLARAALVVQPSLEEGFGLPVAEAMAAGIPVAVSSGGSLPEITRGTVPTFDPTDVSAIAHAIDVAAQAPPPADLPWAAPVDLAAAMHEAALLALEIVRSSDGRANR